MGTQVQIPISYEKLNIEACLYNPSTSMKRWEVETEEDPEAWGLVSLVYNVVSNETSYFKPEASF